MSAEDNIKEILEIHLGHIDKEFTKINLALAKLDDIAIINERLKKFESHTKDHHELVVKSIREYQHTPEWELHIDNRIYTSRDIQTFFNKLVDDNLSSKRIKGLDNIKKEGLTGIRAMIVVGVTAIVTFLIKEIFFNEKS
jgi:hypothetical protein